MACVWPLHRERPGWAQVGDFAEQSEQLRDVLELRGAPLHPEPGPVRGDLDGGLELDERRGPGIGAVQAEFFEALGLEVMLEYVHLQQRVRARGAGKQRCGLPAALP